MADVKISELPALTSPDGAEELVVNDGGTTKKITIANATSAALPKAGGTMTGDTLHGDNVKAKFGTGNDLTIHHDGSNSYITDSGTGDLIVLGNNVQLRNTAFEYYLTCNTDAGVTAYHNNAAKLATTSTGVSVTGTLSTGKVLLNDNGNSTIAGLQLGNQGIGLSVPTTDTLHLLTADQTRMMISSTGNVGIGVVPETWNTAWDVLQVGNAGVFAGRTDSANGIDLGSNFWFEASASSFKRIVSDKASRYNSFNGTHVFQVAATGAVDSAISWTNAMTIDNARSVLIGRPNAGWSDTQGLALNQGNSGENYVINNGVVFYINRGNTEGKTIRFYKSIGTEVGNISTFGASTAYNTSSDYRIKTDVQPITAAADRVKLLKPCNFEWIADGSRADGFLAHELAEVVPIAVTGAKDAMEDEEYEVTPAVVDDEDNETTAAVMGTRSVPDLQGIDQSKLVPLLTATIQELITRIEALEAAAPE